MLDPAEEKREQERLEAAVKVLQEQAAARVARAKKYPPLRLVKDDRDG